MGEREKYAPGTFCWVELGTSDPSDAKRFYQGLFGWAIHDRPIGPDMFYTMLRVGDRDVAALYGQSDEQRAQGVPPNWMSYVSVDDADDVAKEAARLGGEAVVQPFDVFDSGRMAVIRDPTGAVFGVWQPKDHIGARLVNQPGAFCWNELVTRDRVAAATFYTRLFGWGSQVMEMPGGPYTVFQVGDRAGAGMLQMPEEWGAVPPHWMAYFAVADCDAAVSRVRDLGGKVLAEPMDIPVGRFAVAQDPQGAAFAVIQLANPDD